MWIALPITIVATLALMKLVPGEVAVGLKKQFSIFDHKHNWIMTWLYIMTFGSFIGFSMAFPLLIRVVFGTLADGSTVNPEAPNPFTYAWLGPLVGSLIRPVGGWLSDKWTGAKVTQLSTAVMILSTLGVAHYVQLANVSDRPQDHFFPFLDLVLDVVHDQRHRQRLDLPHDRRDLRAGAGRSGSWAGLPRWPRTGRF